MEQICFLHAYLGLDFRPVARPKPPTTGLSALVSVSHRSLRDLFCVFLRHYVLSAHRHGLEWRPVQAPCARISQSTILRLGSESIRSVASYIAKRVLRDLLHCSACLHNHSACCQNQIAPRVGSLPEEFGVYYQKRRQKYFFFFEYARKNEKKWKNICVCPKIVVPLHAFFEKWNFRMARKWNFRKGQ